MLGKSTLKAGFYEICTIKNPDINNIKDPKERQRILLSLLSDPIDAGAFHCPYIPLQYYNPPIV